MSRRMRNNNSLNVDDDDDPDHRDGAPSTFTFSDVRVGLVNVCGGLTFGFAIGMVAILVYAYQTSAKCLVYSSDPTLCEAFAHCSWDTEDRRCVPLATAECQRVTDAAACVASPRGCAFDGSTSTCAAASVGWGSFHTGVFVSAMTLGGLFGSLIAGSSRQATRRRDMAVAAITFACSTVASHVFWQADDFWPLVASRGGVGLAVGALCVLCPLTVGELASPRAAPLLGVLFQVFITLGIAFAALCGWALQDDFRAAHAMLLVSNLIAVQLLPVLWMLNTSCIPGSVTARAQESNGAESSGDAKAPASSGVAALLADPRMRRSLVAALVLSLAQQGSGINAVMGYAPSMVASTGVAPLTGNLLIMFWNFITTLISIPLASRYAPRELFTLALFGVSISCIVTFTAMTINAGMFWSVLTSLGLAAFILFFEIGMGPMFFVIAQDLFPAHVRDAGCSFVNVAQFVINLMVGLFYPMLVELWSPSSTQTNVGIGRTFLVFGLVGISCTAALRKLLSGGGGMQQQQQQR